jgi:hypothetical protein
MADLIYETVHKEVLDTMLLDCLASGREDVRLSAYYRIAKSFSDP